jgi:cytochrome c-type biogenesis protein CcmE
MIWIKQRMVSNMRTRHQRIAFIILALCGLGVATFLVAKAFRSNLVFFVSPSEIASKTAPIGQTLRLGGLVEKGSRKTDGLTHRFAVTDTVSTIPVVYTGILPDLFKEGRGCVVKGRVENDGVFHADEVLAKHDENYMAPEAAKSIEEASKHAKDAAKTAKE